MLYKFFKEEHELIIKEENKVQGKKKKKNELRKKYFEIHDLEI
jgi:hypothetical protein